MLRINRQIISKLLSGNSTTKTIEKVGLEINASSSINYLELDRLRKNKVETLTLRNLEILKEEKTAENRNTKTHITATNIRLKTKRRNLWLLAYVPHTKVC